MKNVDKIYELFSSISKTTDIAKIHSMSNYGISLFDNTREHFVKCSNDPIYFIENYLKIQTAQGEEVPFKLWQKQKEYITFATTTSNHCKYVKNTRQSGLTTLNCALIAWRFLFESDKSIVYIGTNQANISHASQLIYRFIGQFLDKFNYLYGKSFIVTANKFEIRTASGNTVIFLSDKQKQSIRGKSINYVYLDEVEFFDNFREILTSLQHAMNINNKNLICGGTKKGKGWRSNMSVNTKYFTFDALDNPTRDLNWVISTIKSIGLEQFEIEYIP